jgi:hypothetical protein
MGGAFSDVVSYNPPHSSATTGSLTPKTGSAPALDQQWRHGADDRNCRSAGGSLDGVAGDGLTSEPGRTDSNAIVASVVADARRKTPKN